MKRRVIQQLPVLLTKEMMALNLLLVNQKINYLLRKTILDILLLVYWMIVDGVIRYLLRIGSFSLLFS